MIDRPDSDPVLQASEEDGDLASTSGGIHLREKDWRRLEDLSLSLHGVLELIRCRGFDNSCGAPELLRLTADALERHLSRMRRGRKAMMAAGHD